jgi:L-iditol 2-dehydrogenase
MGPAETVLIERHGGQAGMVRRAFRASDNATDDPQVVVECTGAPQVWADAIETVRPGGLVNLFGGCASGTTVALDTHRLHYSEITVKGVYHHRPATFARALSLLSDPSFAAGALLSAHRSAGGRAARHDAQGSPQGRHRAGI